ncbi:hypothetical protein EKK58_00405 [Candidatus Dependentiae bacterium]|nr:MAG: hypothetical protein EKK58_00405 [Candidatus Dependentiae bacterium]
MSSTMRDVMQEMEGTGYESGLSLLLVRDDGPVKKDGKPTSLRKYTVVGSFVSPPIFESKQRPGAEKDDLCDPNTLTQLWQGQLSFHKEVVHTNPHRSVTGFHSLNELVEQGGLNPGMYLNHETIR